MSVLGVNLLLAVVLFGQKTAAEPGNSPLSRTRPSSTISQRADGVPSCEGLVEEVGDRDRLPPWAMGWLMPQGSFVSVFRFNTLRQAQACAAGTEFVVRRWDRQSGTWRKP